MTEKIIDQLENFIPQWLLKTRSVEPALQDTYKLDKNVILKK